MSVHKGGEPPVATSSVLYAAARELSRVCGRVNADYLACKARDENPAACLAEGERVQRCSLNLIKELSAQCPSEFTGYAACIDRQASEEYMFEHCRSEQAALAGCRSAAARVPVADAAAAASVVAAASTEESK
ncbi:hypothetical protein MMPV_006073 [Pyropia vietnamensis]